jgi:hypothetical protein
VGIAHHLGWAVAVTATSDHQVVDRRRIDLIEPDVPPAPVEHEIKLLNDAAAAAVVARVRASAIRASSVALDVLASELPRPIVAMSLRTWPLDFPVDVRAQRRAPYASRADSVMYVQILAELAHQRGWALHLYDPKDVEGQAAHLLGPRAEEILRGPRARLGPPWAKDHRMALAATVMAG